MLKKWKENKGFTLAELLIVVAIIGVLVAVSIPVFTGQLEKSREATDLANVRSAYARVRTAAITGDAGDSEVTVDDKETYSMTVDLKQKQGGWQTNTNALNIGGITPADNLNWVGTPNGEGTCKVSCDTKGNTVINWGVSVINMNVSEEMIRYKSSLNAILNALKTVVVDERLKTAGRHVSYIQINNGKVTQVSYYKSEGDKGNNPDNDVNKGEINQKFGAAIAGETYRGNPYQSTASRIFLTGMET